MKISDFGANGVYQVGRVVSAKSATYERMHTEPPRRYTQSDLIDDMMAAYKFAKNDAERNVLKQISGLGTSRTRESTISAMIARGFLTVRKSSRERGRSELIPSDAARTIIENLPEMLTSVAMTAKWELAFRLVEQGKATADEVRKHLKATLDKIVAEARAKGTIRIQEAPAYSVSPKNNQFSSRSGAGRGASLRPAGRSSSVRT